MIHPMLRRQAATAGAVLAVGGIAFCPRQTAWAESPPSDPATERSLRKPIYSYDDVRRTSAKVPNPGNNQPEEKESSSTRSPSSTSSLPSLSRVSGTLTDQLAGQVRHARLFLYAHSLAAENAFNDTLSRVLHVESRFTNTIASLAPPLESGERLLPGAIYVLVSAMAGSIISRNRGILLRTATPVAVGTVAAYALLPITMRNVGDLVWEYEKRVPALAENHVRVRTMAEESWRRAVAHKGYARDWLETKVGDGREVLEEWLKRGK